MTTYDRFSIPLKTLTELWSKSANLCAFPTCKRSLIRGKFNDDSSSEVLSGEACHIVARTQHGPRSESLLKSKQNNDYENLILLCNVHHHLIHTQTNIYTVEYLQDMRGKHEQWVHLHITHQERTVLKHPETELYLSKANERIRLYSPSISLLQQLYSSRISLHDLHWRQFEELVAELLTNDGYQVQLGRGTKDEGVDIIAIKKDPIVGLLKTVWQAKKLNPENKVDIRVIRELADTRQQHNATKGIIATTTFLTKDAMKRIEQDCYILGKVDGNDLSSWIQKDKPK